MTDPTAALALHDRVYAIHAGTADHCNLSHGDSLSHRLLLNSTRVWGERLPFFVLHQDRMAATAVLLMESLEKFEHKVRQCCGCLW